MLAARSVMAAMALGIGGADVVERPAGPMAIAVVPVAAQLGPPPTVSLQPPALLPLPLSPGAPVAAVASMIPVVPVPIICRGAVRPGQEHADRR